MVAILLDKQKQNYFLMITIKLESKRNTQRESSSVKQGEVLLLREDRDW